MYTYKGNSNSNSIFEKCTSPLRHVPLLIHIHLFRLIPRNLSPSRNMGKEKHPYVKGTPGILAMSFSLFLSLLKNFERKIRVSVFRAAIRGSRFTRSGLRNPYLDEISRFWDVKGRSRRGGKKGGAKLPAYFPIPYWPGQSCPRGYRGFIWRMLATHRFLFLAGVKSSIPRGCCQPTLLPILWPLFYRKAFFSWHRHAPLMENKYYEIFIPRCLIVSRLEGLSKLRFYWKYF